MHGNLVTYLMTARGNLVVCLATAAFLLWYACGVVLLARIEKKVTGLSFARCMAKESARQSLFFRNTSRVFFLALLGPLLPLAFRAYLAIAGRMAN
jgi:hypothetical protein